MPIRLLFITLVAIAWGLWKARRDYRLHGRQTVLGLISVCVMFLMPHLWLDAAMIYDWPHTLLDLIGLFVSVLGLGLCLSGMVALRSAGQVFCLNAGQLTVFGPYRFSRNPQYLGWGIFVLGFALNGWSAQCPFALAVYATVVHLLVLVEEEHLTRVFGDAYREYCKRVPRYCGWMSSRPTS